VSVEPVESGLHVEEVLFGPLNLRLDNDQTR
jgi:hypothetical protein